MLEGRPQYFCLATHTTMLCYVMLWISHDISTVNPGTPSDRPTDLSPMGLVLWDADRHRSVSWCLPAQSLTFTGMYLQACSSIHLIRTKNNKRSSNIINNLYGYKPSTMSLVKAFHSETVPTTTSARQTIRCSHDLWHGGLPQSPRRDGEA